MKRRGLLCAAVGAATGLPSLQAWAQPAVVPKPDATPLVLENTVAHLLTARESARVYPIWVDLPRSYGEPESARRRYPVVVAADAPWSHAYLRTIRNFVGRRGQNIEDFILVGLAPEQGLSHLDYRARDYTPSDPHRRPGKGGQDYGSLRYGEAARYQGFLAEQVLPFVAQHYRCDARRQVFIGHSYGSLLGLHVMLSQPELFGHYILGSPSLWFDQRVMFDMEKATAAGRRDLPARVRMYAGGFETFGKTPRHFKTTDLVGDMKAFERQLRSRRYPSLAIASQVIADEDHFTVFPSLAARGLTWALPGHGPYTSG
jgi:predicted alpha/beta superfamily hydrolase